MCINIFFLSIDVILILYWCLLFGLLAFLLSFVMKNFVYVQHAQCTRARKVKIMRICKVARQKYNTLGSRYIVPYFRSCPIGPRVPITGCDYCTACNKCIIGPSKDR